jgi:hypothetical protein
VNKHEPPEKKETLGSGTEIDTLTSLRGKRLNLRQIV